MKHLLLFLVMVSMTWACIPPLQKMTMTEADIEHQTIETAQPPCNELYAYEPDSSFMMRYVRVNLHFMRNDEGKGNFSEEEGVQYAYDLIDACNKRLAENKKMNLPANNETPILPTRFRFVITPEIGGAADDDGIYFHNDSEMYYYLYNGPKTNFTNQQVFDKYGVSKGKVLNIFMMEYPIDSAKSPTFKINLKGIAFPNKGFTKVAGLYYYSRDTMNYDKEGRPVTKGAWFCAGHVNHEIGHILGLFHTWRGNDGCDDTPQNPNCWAYNPNKPCNSQFSNNVMDYNTYQNAWTPCQLAKIHRGFAQETSKTRQLLEPNWCEYDESETVNIYKDVEWFGARDVGGDIIIGNGARLTVHCDVNMPKGSKIIVKPKGQLVVDGGTIQNGCNEEWKGVELWQRGNNKGKVIYQNKARVLQTVKEAKKANGGVMRNE